MTAAGGSVLCLALSGEIDIMQLDALRAFLQPGHAQTAVIVDLSEVTYVDSSALSALVAMRQKLLNDRGGSVALVAVDRHLGRIFQITGLNALFDRFDSFEDACRGLEINANGVERRQFVPTPETR